MKKKNFYFITNKCNANCSYCFVPHDNYVMTKEDIDNLVVPEDGDNVIYGGEPTLYPDLVEYLIQKLNNKNVYLYTNGSNVSFLQTLKDVKIYVNYDAYKYVLHKNVEDILQYDWIFTMAPSNLSYVVDVYNDFLKYDKYAYLKIMSYYQNGSLYWNEESLTKLNDTLQSLYETYSDILVRTNNDYMPYVLRDTLKRLLAYASNQTLDTNCRRDNHFINTDMKCKDCQRYDDNIRCSTCVYKKCCMFNTSCFTNVPCDLCRITNILNDNAYKVFNKLKNNNTFQRTILSIYEDTFYV